MAAMPYMPFYWADWQADTIHLPDMAELIYHRLIGVYWQRGSGCSANAQHLMKAARVDAAMWEQHATDVMGFFEVRDGRLWHGRIEEELEKVRSKSLKNRTSAQKGVAKRRSTKAQPTPSERSANAQRTQSHTDTDADTDAEHFPSTTSESNQERESPGGRVVRFEKKSDPPPAKIQAGFDRFWEAYPNKVGKKAAWASFQRIAKSGEVSFSELMSGLERYSAKADDRQWCNPTTWLNQGRWADEPPAPTSHPGAPTNARARQIHDVFDRVENRINEIRSRDPGGD